MAELSPAAQAVLTAYHQEAIDYIEEWGSFRHKRGMAAALRAAAKQSTFADVAVNKTIEVVPVDILLTIAAELER